MASKKELEQLSTEALRLRSAQAVLEHGAVADTMPPDVNPAVLYRMSLSSSESQKTVMRVLNRLASMLQHKDHYEVPWASLERHHVFALLQQLCDQGRSANTRNLYLSVIKGVAREAFAARQIDADHFQRIKTIKPARTGRLSAGRALGVAEVSELMDHCLQLKGLTGLRDAALLAILFGCGLRRAEVVSIKIANLDLSDRSIRVIGKGDKERRVGVPLRSWDILQLWLQQRGRRKGPVFVAVDRWDNMGRTLSAQTVYDLVRKRVAQAGLDSASPHDLRKGFITYLLDQGVDISTVADMAGHSSIDTTRIYARNQQKRNRAATELIDF